ncbi:UNVERIFIED_CONTAM: S-layer family protein [Acetivibrio alkalicellulosi]
MKNNLFKTFQSILSVVVLVTLLVGVLTSGVVFGSGPLSPENGLQSLINEAQELLVSDRNQFVYNLTQAELDVLRKEAKELTQNQRNSLVSKLDRNDNFDVLMRNILLADGGESLILKDIIDKLENRVMSDLEKLIKEALFLTTIDERRNLAIDFIDNILPEITKDTYLDYVDKVNNIFLGMSKEEVEKALREFSDYSKSQRDNIIFVIRFFDLTNLELDTTGFESIAYDINEKIMNCEYDNLGTKIFIRMLQVASNIGGVAIVNDHKDDVYKISFVLKLPSEMRQVIDNGLQTTSILGKDVRTLEDFLKKVESSINRHSNTEIYYFKLYLRNEFGRSVYSGNLPIPSTESPTTPEPIDTPVTPTTKPSEDEGTIISPTPKPEPGEVEGGKDEVPAVVTFTDIEGHWGIEYIMKLLELGIVSGYPDGSIRPDNNITRAEMSVIVVKAAGLEPSDGANLNFKDSDQIPKWAAGFIQTAVDNGIIVGYEDNTFRASRNITREEMVVLILKAFGILNEQDLEAPAFIDADQIGSWSLDYVKKSVDLNIVVGYQDNSFRPKRSVTRAEAFTVLVKTMEFDID